MKISNFVEFFCSRWEDVGEVVLWKDVVAVENTTLTSVVQVFSMTMRLWDLASCMSVEGVAQVELVEVFAVEGLLGMRVLCAILRSEIISCRCCSMRRMYRKNASR